MRKHASLAVVAFVLAAAAAKAQQPVLPADGEPQLVRAGRGAGKVWAQNLPPGVRGDRDRRPEALGRTPGLGRGMEEIFFPPELVMHNQKAIGLKPEQQEAIRAEMQKAVARFTDLQWQQSAQVETIEALCKKQPVDEKAVLAEFEKLLAIESDVKRLHLASLIRVKNILTAEQQTQLRELERQNRSRPGEPGRRQGASRHPGGEFELGAALR